MRRLPLILAAALALFPLPGAGQVDIGNDAPPDALPDARPDETRAGADAVAEAIRGREGRPEPPVAGLGPGALAEAEKAFIAYYAYRAQGYAHRHEVFRWQLFSSRIIFGAVIALVALGVYFSWLQFMAGRRKSPPAKGEPNPEERRTTSTVKFSTSGIEVSSPVLGVIILAISLAFFYLYLVHVYPINEVL